MRNPEPEDDPGRPECTRRDRKVARKCKRARGEGQT